ncbi:MAG: M28 family metallopeptidase [Allosphingosinicella sp.]|uniref:M28 family metallopeptidase n=1 Tax=Allosphingosinicella sp. TaxID=2823234 RepID=UPI00393EC5B4
MRILLLSLSLILSACAAGPAPQPPLPIQERAAAWWRHVEILAADDMEGRRAGTPGYDRAAAYVVEQFRRIGLEPAGSDGFLQQVELEEQVIDNARSSAALVADGGATPLRLPADMIVAARTGPRAARTEAPLVFVGYGLHIPEAGHDDFAGIDLTGKIAVAVSGGPTEISGALKSHARADRARLLAQRGAAGLITISTPSAQESPWESAMARASQPALYFGDRALRDVPDGFFTASFNPAEGEKLFARSGRAFAEVAALADASAPVPSFALNQQLRAEVAAERRRLTSPNIVARLPGSDRRLAQEHVVLTAHLDGLGVGEPVNGDAIHNGALDNADGVAALIGIAERMRREGLRPRRSILFLIVTAEESGLLGARYFSRRPTVPRAGLVANLNYDMGLPIFPLTSVIALGAEQSSLGRDAAAVGGTMGLPLAPDPFPDRNSFIRSDQYAFIEQGVPALAFKFGFAAGTPEAELERAWRATHYHRPSDDVASTPVHAEDAVRLHDFIGGLALRVADAPERPRWNEDSFFRRFAAGR